MSKQNLLIGAGAVLVLLAIIVLGGKSVKQDDGMVAEESPSPTATATPKPAGAKATPKPVEKETTSSSGTYTCADGKTFTLTTYADGTARVFGANTSTSTVVLRKSSAGIWISGDSRVAVRETGNYTVLMEDSKITRDVCRL